MKKAKMKIKDLPPNIVPLGFPQDVGKTLSVGYGGRIPSDSQGLS
jgi:hypothetical protein